MLHFGGHEEHGDVFDAKTTRTARMRTRTTMMMTTTMTMKMTTMKTSPQKL
jgi:hypothetical protein